MLRIYRLFGWAAMAPFLASAQPDSFIVTLQSTQPALNSLRFLADGAYLYADAYGVYRVRAAQTETLLTNPVQPGYCQLPSFPFGCIWSVPPVYHPKPMAADSSGVVYVADPEQHLIERYDETTKAFVTIATNAGAPTSLAADDHGNLFFNDPAGCRVLRLSQAIVTTVAGTGTCGYSNDGGPATTAEILSPAAIALDAEGQIYIADDKAGVVRRVDGSGIIMTIVGIGTPAFGGEGSPANLTPLYKPGGLALDGQGNLFIAETGANRIRMVGADGLVRTIAGAVALGHGGDDGLAVTAQLTAPTCLAVSAAGALRICDSDRIRKLIPPVAGLWTEPTSNLNARKSPNSWMTLFGDYPGVTATGWSGAIGPDGSLPTSLAGVTVTVSGIPCVLSYVSPDRIDLLLPASLPQGPQTLTIRWPDGTTNASVYVTANSPEFLGAVAGEELYPAALAPDSSWITPAQPTHPGETIRLYITGVSLAGPVTPPYDLTQPGGMQVILNAAGYPVQLARPFSPGVSELTVQLPADLASGAPAIRVFAGYMSTAATLLPVAQ